MGSDYECARSHEAQKVKRRIALFVRIIEGVGRRESCWSRNDNNRRNIVSWFDVVGIDDDDDDHREDVQLMCNSSCVPCCRRRWRLAMVAG